MRFLFLSRCLIIESNPRNGSFLPCRGCLSVLVWEPVSRAFSYLFSSSSLFSFGHSLEERKTRLGNSPKMPHFWCTNLLTRTAKKMQTLTMSNLHAHLQKSKVHQLWYRQNICGVAIFLAVDMYSKLATILMKTRVTSTHDFLTKVYWITHRTNDFLEFDHVFRDHFLFLSHPSTFGTRWA
jgi:hypothetical protein